MKGNVIIIATDPKGVFLEGIIGDTSKPGTKMQISAGVAPVAGRHTWVAYNPSADGDPRLSAILLDDQHQGFLPNAAYVAGKRGRLYVPLPGEEMNVLVEGEAGTGSANAFTIGERLQAVHGTGKYKAQATSANRSDFTVMEHIDEIPDVDTLVWCIYTGG